VYCENELNIPGLMAMVAKQAHFCDCYRNMGHYLT